MATELGQHGPPLLRGERGEGLGVGLLDGLRRCGAQQVAVTLDRRLVTAPTALPGPGGTRGVLRRARRCRVLRRVALRLVAVAAEQPVQESHGGPFVEESAEKLML